MSPAFSAITRAMNSTLAAIASIKGAQLGPEFAKAAADVKLAENAIENLNKDLANLGSNDALTKQSRSAMELNAALDIVGKGIRLVQQGINEIGKLTGLQDVQQQSEMALAVVMGNQGQSLESYKEILAQATELQKNTTIGDEALLAGMAEIATYISDPEALQAMMPSFADFAIGMNNGGARVGEAQAVQYATALGKALQGQYDGLTKKGFIVSDMQKEILENGTDMERVAAAVEIVSESWDGMAAAVASTDLGQIVQMENTTRNLKEELGNGLYPYVLETQQLLQGALVPVLGFVIDNINTIAPLVQALGAGFIGAAVAVGVYTVAQWVATGAASAFFAVLMANPLTWIVLLVGAVVFAIARWVQSVGGIEIAWATCVDAVLTWAGNMKVEVLTSFEEMINGALGLLNGFITKMNNVLGTSFGTFGTISLGSELANTENEAAKLARSENIAALQAKRLEEKEDPIASMLSGAMTDSAGGKALNVKNSEPVKIDGEDIKMLLELSTRDYQPIYQTLTPQLVVSDVTVRETADINQVIGVMADWIEEVSESSLREPVFG